MPRRTCILHRRVPCCSCRWCGRHGSMSAAEESRKALYWLTEARRIGEERDRLAAENELLAQRLAEWKQAQIDSNEAAQEWKVRAQVAEAEAERLTRERDE